ncbi:IniB N-terminal domain-containing protein [Pseudonocardia zijingensis]|uniref:Uncharacterized protein n=1 Tax=Pseudonocardia zijingensis TaxID=153376 RepID=A0ABN1N636_9PSEU
MAQPLSLMEFLQALLTDADLRGDFGDDPQGTLAAHGLADLTPADVHDALVLVQDTQTVDYSLDAAVAAPPPLPADDGHEAAVEYLARYLSGPQEPDPGAGWTDPDPDLAPAPLDGFGAGDDTASRYAPEHAWEGVAEPAWVEADPAPADADPYDLPDPHAVGPLDDLAGFTGFTDLHEDVPDFHDGDATLPGGA